MRAIMSTKPTISWHERAQAARFPTQAFIGGRYVDAASGETFDSINPATGKLLAQVAAGDAADVDRAVAAARDAFRKGSWAGLPPAKRKRVLQKFAELICSTRKSSRCSRRWTWASPSATACSVDIPAAARCIEWYAEAIDKIYDEMAPTGRTRWR